jgi:hypothetical protein
MAIILTAVFTVTASGCSLFQKPGPTVSPSASASAAASPSEQVSAEPSADETDTTSPEASEDASPADVTESATIAPTIDPNDYFAIGDELMQLDGIGSIKVNMTENDLVTAMGQPDSKSEPVIWGADGLEHSDWIYGKVGLQINMAKAPEDASSIVYTILASAPCTLTTQRGIKIGDTKDAVLTAYAEGIDPAANPDTSSSIVIGSVYGGIVVDIEDDLVKAIFIGASAE